MPRLRTGAPAPAGAAVGCNCGRGARRGDRALGVFAAPRSTRRLARAARVPFELSVFGLAVAALLAAGSPVAGVVFGVVVFINSALMTVFRQWDR